MILLSVGQSDKTLTPITETKGGNDKTPIASIGHRLNDQLATLWSAVKGSKSHEVHVVMHMWSMADTSLISHNYSNYKISNFK